MTAVANAPFTAADFNVYVRDNLLETAAAKATGVGRYFVATGPNAIAERQAGQSTASTELSTTSTNYVELSGGPTVSAVTGTSALVAVTARITNSTTGSASYASYAVSGATTVTANDSRGIRIEKAGADYDRVSMVRLATGLTVGTNVFTMQYRVGAGEGFFSQRELTVVPF